METNKLTPEANSSEANSKPSIKDVMILIAYINVSNIPPHNVLEYTKGIQDSFGKVYDKYSDVELIYVPTHEGATRVEMIKLN